MADDEFKKLSNDLFDEITDFEAGQKKLESLKRMRERVNWEIGEERESFYWQLCRLINDWKSRLPDLREIFRREEIDWLLTKCVKIGPTELIKFVIRTGYKDEPDLDDDGKPLLCRNTPVNYAAEHRIRDWISKVRELFKIYDKFNANYTNETGFTHFHAACKSGCDEIVKKFLELGQDPNCIVRETGDSALHLALRHKQREVVQLLLRNHADPNWANKKELTPLHIICRGDNDVELFEEFFKITNEIQQTVQVEARDIWGRTPLHWAVHYRHMELVDLLLRRGADVNSKDAGEHSCLHFIGDIDVAHDVTEKFFEICGKIQLTVQVNALNKLGNTPLHLALRNDKQKMVECLLRNGADPNIADAGGFTSLHLIALRGINDDYAEKFFEICNDMQLKVQVNAQENHGRTPLQIAVCLDKEHVVESLLRNGADPNIADVEKCTSLHSICATDYDDKSAEKFFQICDDMQLTMQVDAQSKLGWTPLHLALFKGKKKATEWLLRRGVNPNLATKEGYTPLHAISCREIDDDFAEWFFEICDDMNLMVQVDARNTSGETPLHLALNNGKERNIKDLLRKGSDPNLTNTLGYHPLHIIASRPIDDELVEKFIKMCSDIQLSVQVDFSDKHGRTPLHLALLNGKKQNVKDLLRRGANPNSADTCGLLPLHVICNGQHDDDLVKLFFEIADVLQQTMQVDAQDEWGLTPLETAVGTLSPAGRRKKNQCQLNIQKAHHQRQRQQQLIVPRKEMITSRPASRTSRRACPAFSCNDTATIKSRAVTARLPPSERFYIYVIFKEPRAPAFIHVARGHRAARFYTYRIRDWISKVRELFKIYDKFNANYTNETGFTHFHAACKSGCDEIVKKFLELGQDPNCIVRETGDSALHLALRHKPREVVQLLLRSHADPNWANKKGLTPLHIICRNSNDSDDIVNMLFELSDDKYQPMSINAQEKKFSNTPLHLALRYRNKKIVELLLKRGANPNLANAQGIRPLHCAIYSMIDKDLTEKFFEMFGNIEQTVQVDVRDKWGRTPLHLALSKSKKKAAESLLRIGANPNLADEKGYTCLHYIVWRSIDNGSAERFFQICDDIQQTVQVDTLNTRGKSPLHFALSKGKKKVAESLLRRGANPNLASAKGLTSLHLICETTYDDNSAEKFFQICDDMQLTMEIDALDKLGQTPLHLALGTGKKKMVECLLRNGADPNIADAEGLSSLHHIASRRIDDDLAEKFLQITFGIQQTVQVNAKDKLGMSPLHYALSYNLKNVVKSLLKRGGDPNLADLWGGTSLHRITFRQIDDDLMKWFLEICDNMQLKVQVDALDEYGDTPLHVALRNGEKKATESLLRRGADPNLTSADELTSLHHITLRKIDDDLMKWFFEICDNMQLKVQVDARSKSGNTALHNALYRGKKKAAESLLRRGVNPNLANGKGFHPLHIVSCTEPDGGLVKLFFEIADDVQQTVQVDAQDKKGRTPLQTAVANLSPGVVDVLLDRGADLSKFVFPIEELFRKSFDKNDRKWDKLKLASGILAVVECLNKRGYELDRSDVLTIIKLFVEYESFEKSSDLLEKFWRNDEEFTSKAIEVTIIPNCLSLFDLLLLQPEEAAKLLTYTNYFEIERLNNLDKIPEQYRDKCLRYLCEKMSRRYFKKLSLDAFQELIHYRLPILCSEMVMDNLMNEDLFRIYEAGEIVAKESKAKLSDTVDNGPVDQKVQFIKSYIDDRGQMLRRPPADRHLSLSLCVHSIAHDIYRENLCFQLRLVPKPYKLTEFQVGRHEFFEILQNFSPRSRGNSMKVEGSGGGVAVNATTATALLHDIKIKEETQEQQAQTTTSSSATRVTTLISPNLPEKQQQQQSNTGTNSNSSSQETPTDSPVDLDIKSSGGGRVVVAASSKANCGSVSYRRHCQSSAGKPAANSTIIQSRESAPSAAGRRPAARFSWTTVPRTAVSRTGRRIGSSTARSVRPSYDLIVPSFGSNYIDNGLIDMDKYFENLQQSINQSIQSSSQNENAAHVSTHSDGRGGYETTVSIRGGKRVVRAGRTAEGLPYYEETEDLPIGDVIFHTERVYNHETRSLDVKSSKQVKEPPTTTTEAAAPVQETTTAAAPAEEQTAKPSVESSTDAPAAAEVTGICSKSRRRRIRPTASTCGTRRRASCIRRSTCTTCTRSTAAPWPSTAAPSRAAATAATRTATTITAARSTSITRAPPAIRTTASSASSTRRRRCSLRRWHPLPAPRGPGGDSSTAFAPLADSITGNVDSLAT
ncbi:unnamed protein product [Trichogramma brassicae]|uniref:Uncharacterized protein n=1 Tax=Trichogramma brassicae TaxID=86971 RepID=A0A6H5IW87_9HYME|nr:unnamed protein product [Trichogramma brassicae]